MIKTYEKDEVTSPCRYCEHGIGAAGDGEDKNGRFHFSESCQETCEEYKKFMQRNKAVRLQKAVYMGYITDSEYKMITGTDYTAPTGGTT